MPRTYDFSDLSEDELQDVISEATRRLEQLRADTAREAVAGPSGSKGQDVRKPAHGAIAAPTPNEVEVVAPAHGVDPNRSATPSGGRIDEDDLDRAGKAIDEGLSYAAPTSTSLDPEKREDVEQGFDPFNRDKG